MLPVIPAKRIQTEKHTRSQRKSALLSFVFACYIIKSIINQLKFGKKTTICMLNKAQTQIVRANYQSCSHSQ